MVPNVDGNLAVRDVDVNFAVRDVDRNRFILKRKNRHTNDPLQNHGYDQQTDGHH